MYECFTHVWVMDTDGWMDTSNRTVVNKINSICTFSQNVYFTTIMRHQELQDFINHKICYLQHCVNDLGRFEDMLGEKCIIKSLGCSLVHKCNVSV